ncbi:MAG: hypothetical protein K0S51_394 [Bacillales bacterium]|nr:hypothetical protein [Bacillales bacterium]
MYKFNKKRKGYTLIEFNVVLVGMILILSMFFAPRYIKVNLTEFYYLKRLKYDLIYAQNYSMRKNDKVFIYFNINDGSYNLRNSPLSKPILSRQGSNKINITNITTTNPISYSSSGAINQAGKIEFNISGRKSTIVLYIGSGRSNVET